MPLARSLLFPTAVRRSTECAAFITCRWRSSHAACGSPEPHTRIARAFPSDHARPGVCGGTPRPGWRRARPGSPLRPELQTCRDLSHALGYYDPQLRRVVVIGGESDPKPGDRDQVWVWSGTRWTRAAESGPPGRVTAAAAADGARRRAVVAGGGRKSADGIRLGDRGRQLGSRTAAPGAGRETFRRAIICRWSEHDGAC